MHINNLSKFYFINKFKKNNIDKIPNNTAIIYRNYENKNNINEIIKIRFYCRKKKIKFFLSNNFKLALKLGLDGAYIPSFNINFRHLSYKIPKKFKILGSAHNKKQINIKELQKVDILFLSSLFKKNKNYLGLYRFNSLSYLTKKKIVCLGGISKENLKKIMLTNSFGFSGISYFE
mgnify:FL=1